MRFILSVQGAFKETPNNTELREYLSHTLPNYMIPSYFIFLDNMPLTPNGKNRQESTPGYLKYKQEKIPPYIEPRNLTEDKLAEIWSKYWGSKKNSSYDPAFSS